MPSYLITGAGRGLGLGFVTELLKNTNNVVIATARSTTGSPGLQELKAKFNNDRLHLVDLDVSNAESITKAAGETAKLLPNGLDNLVSNAGVDLTGSSTFEELDIDLLMKDLKFTLGAPLLLIRAFLPLIRKSEDKRILLISSILGSVQIATSVPGAVNGYSVARAALNMLGRKWSPILKSEGVTLAMAHPGWVGTTGIGDGLSDWVAKYNPSLENLPVEKSAADVMKVLNSITIEDSGSLINHDRTKLPF